MFLKVARPLTFALLAVLSTSALAAKGMQQLDTPYPKIVLDQDIEVVMRDFSEDLGVTVVVDREIGGLVRQMDPGLTARRFLDRVAGSLSATWFYSNDLIYVTPLADVDQIVFNVARVGRNDLERALSGIEIQAGREPLTFGSAGRTAMASGSPELLRLISDIVRLEGGFVVDEENGGEEGQGETVTAMAVFRGRVTE